MNEDLFKEILHQHGLKCMELGEKTVINSLIQTMNCLKTMSPEATMSPDFVIGLLQDFPSTTESE